MTRRREIEKTRDDVIARVFQRGDGAVRRRIGMRLRYLREKWGWTSRQIEVLRGSIYRYLELEDRR